MKNAVTQYLIGRFPIQPFTLLTGDLGFRMFEPLQTIMGDRFINAGVAEQHMCSLAAGIAHTGIQTWVYSIAPFLYARALEQIRNDIGLHHLSVRLIGNGAGYSYGVLGPTHHALEDYGVLLTVDKMRIFAPAFAQDIPVVMDSMNTYSGPSYLRLARCELPEGVEIPPYTPWRKLLHGDAGTAIVIGTLTGSCLGAWRSLPQDQRPNLWQLAELPLPIAPDELIDDLRRGGLCIAEDHIAQGSAASLIASWLLQHHIMPDPLINLHALGYPSGQYGSQSFHRVECGLTPQNILARLRP